MNLEPVNQPNVDIGQGDLYIGPPYEIKYFFESPWRKMMREPDETTIDFKTWKGEFFQFCLDTFHGHKALVLTSTLGDTFFIYANTLSLEKSADRFRKSFDTRHPIKDSFSGYFTYGGHLLDNYSVLKAHMAEQNIYFSDETIQWIWQELKRREKNERVAGT